MRHRCDRAIQTAFPPGPEGTVRPQTAQHPAPRPLWHSTPSPAPAHISNHSSGPPHAAPTPTRAPRTTCRHSSAPTSFVDTELQTRPCSNCWYTFEPRPTCWYSSAASSIFPASCSTHASWSHEAAVSGCASPSAARRPASTWRSSSSACCPRPCAFRSSARLHSEVSVAASASPSALRCSYGGGTGEADKVAGRVKGTGWGARPVCGVACASLQQGHCTSSTRI